MFGQATAPARRALTATQRVARDRRIREAFERGLPVAEIARRRRRSLRWVYKRLGLMARQQRTADQAPKFTENCEEI
jgi:hypothetical protein